MKMITQLNHLKPPMLKLVCYCAECRATSTFILMETVNEWACVGSPATLREGCGKRLRPVVKSVKRPQPESVNASATMGAMGAMGAAS